MATPLPPGFSLIDNDTAPEGFTPVKKPDIDPDSLLGRVGEKIGKRVEKVERSSKMYSEGDITYPEFALRGLGFAYGSLFDTVGEGVMSILAALTPDEAEEFLQEQISSGVSQLMSTDTAKEMLSFYKELTPRQKDNIGDIFDVAMAGMPKTGVAQKLTKSGIEGDKRQLAKSVLSNSTAAKEARMGEFKLPKNMQKVARREDQIVNTVLSLAGITGSTSRKKLMGAINQETVRLTNQVKQSLAKQKMSMPKQSLNTTVSKAFNDLLEQKTLYKNKKFKNLRQDILDSYKNALEKYDGKPESLLQLRKDFDNNVKTTLGKDVHATDTAARDMTAAIRDSLNNTLEAIAPDEQIKAAMRRQHNLILAKQNLKANMAREGSQIDKAISFVNQHPFMTAGALGGSGVYSRILGSEPFAVGLTGAAGIYGATRPATRRVLGAAGETLPVKQGMLYSTADQIQEEE
jgi:hypothetical protein